MKVNHLKLTILLLAISLFATPVLGEESKNQPSFSEDLPLNLPPEVTGERAYPLGRWNVSAMLEMALKKLPNFTRGIPGNVRRVTVMRVNSDDRVYVNTRAIQHRLSIALKEDTKFQLVECRECQNVKLFVEQDSVIVSRNIETTSELKKLGKSLKIDAFLFVDVQLDDQAGELALGLKLVQASNGSVLKIGTLTGSHSGERIHWTVEGDKDGGMVVSGPIKEDALGKELLTSSVSRGSVLLPEAYMNPLEEKDSSRLTRLIDFALLRFPEFTKKISGKSRKVAIGTFEGSQNYYLSTGLLRQKLLQAVIDQEQLELVTCSTCGKMEAVSSKGKIVFKSAVETRAELRALKKNTGADILLRGRIRYVPEESALDLSLQAIQTANGKVLYAQTYRGKEQQGLHDWRMTLIPDTGFYVEGPITDPESEVSHEDNVLTTAIVSREFYIPAMENDRDLPETSLKTDYLAEVAFQKIQILTDGLPSGMDGLAVAWLEGDDEVYVNTRLIRYRLIQALMEKTDKQIIDCFECQKWGYQATEEGIIPQKQVGSFEEIQKLGKKQGFQGYITGFIEAREDINELKVHLQVVNAENGRIIKTNGFKAKQAAGQSNLAFMFAPISGFTYKHYRDAGTGYEEVDSNSFMSLGLRYLKGTPIAGFMIGGDFEMIQNSPKEQDDQVSANLISVIMKYSFSFFDPDFRPFSAYMGVGFGQISADAFKGTNVTGFKGGMEYRISDGFSLGLDMYSLSSIEFEDGLENASFTGDGTAITLRFYF